MSTSDAGWSARAVALLLVAAVIVACTAPASRPGQSSPGSGSPSGTAARPLDSWLLGWKPELDAYLAARKAFAEVVGRLSATYADVGRAAQTLATDARSLRSALAATPPPPGSEADAQAVLTAADSVITALDGVVAACSAGPSGCTSSINTWRPADAALTAALSAFVAMPS